MGRIIVLDENTSGRIAAGEVVDRPASVVKELVENSLDAGASRVEVEVEDGGGTLIRVSDDGVGMDATDARLAFERHATSKLVHASDLERIATYGFRGEALASVASVARVRLLTCLQGAGEGTEVVAEGGRIISHRPGGARPGTSIWVRDLFYNTPARRAALRSAQAETGRVVEVLSALALAAPTAAISLASDGRPLWTTPGTGSLREAAATIFGASFAGELLEVAGRAGRVRISGLIGRPGFGRRDGKRQYLFVNGRSVRPSVFRRAIDQVYESLLPAGGTPVWIVHVETDPAEVDVNLHPAKTEVRFRDSAEAYRAVTAVLREGLSRAGIRQGLSRPAGGHPAARVGTTLLAESEGRVTEPDARSWRTGRTAFTGVPVDWREAIDPRRWGLVGEETGGERFPNLEPMGQFGLTFIAARGADGLYIIDQHAAHERICYEGLLRDRRGKGSQILAVPEVLELTAAEAALLEASSGLLREAGLEIEPFGSQAVVVRGIPSALTGVPAGRLIMDYLDRLEHEAERKESAASRAARVMAACKAALKAGERLEHEGMAALIADLAAADQPWTCPHGRPTVLRFDLKSLRREFSR